MRIKCMLTVLFLASIANPCSAQNFLEQQQLHGLKGVTNVAFVLRPNMQREVIPMREWGDLVQVQLARDLPRLELVTAEEASAWLVLSVVTVDGGASLELLLYRWATLPDGSDIFASVWSDTRLLFGSVSRRDLEDALRPLLTGFIADYVRAGQEENNGR